MSLGDQLLQELSQSMSERMEDKILQIHREDVERISNAELLFAYQAKDRFGVSDTDLKKIGYFKSERKSRDKYQVGEILSYIEKNKKNPRRT